MTRTTTTHAPTTTSRAGGDLPTRLVLVEGLIGTGKTTITGLVAELLAERGVTVRVGAEGDPANPADLERVAVVERATVERLGREHPGWAGRLGAVTRPAPCVPGALRPAVAGTVGPADDDAVWVSYGCLEQDHGPLPDALRAELAARDAYELPFADHVPVRLAQWQEFVDAASATEEVWVLDCCAVQNPVTIGSVRDDLPGDVVGGLVRALIGTAAPLAPVVVRLRRDDVAVAVGQAVAERPAWWSGSVVDYYTGGALGRRLGAQGVEGLVRVLEAREAVETRILDAVASDGVPVLEVVTTLGDTSAACSALTPLVDHIAAAVVGNRLG